MTRQRKFRSSNGHIVRPYGFLMFWVGSRTRKDMEHLCDLNWQEVWRFKCSCEAYDLQGQRPCRHILACCEWLAAALKLNDDDTEVFMERMEYLGGLPLPRATRLDPEEQPHQQAA